MIAILLAFAASSGDDFILLVCLYADRRASVHEITAAKMMGVLLALGAAIACAATFLTLPLTLSKTLGLIPLALGVKRLIDQHRPRTGTGAASSVTYAHLREGGMARRIARYVATIFAASLDNVALYIPLFARENQAAIVSTAGTLLSLSLLLCAAALLSSRVPVPFHAAYAKLNAAVPYLMMYIGIKALATSFL